MRLTGTVMTGSHHPDQEHEAPPAVTLSQEPSCGAGKAQTKQASSALFLSHSHLVLEDPQVLVVPVKEKYRKQLQEQPFLSAVYSANTLLSNAESGKVSWLPSCWPLHWSLSEYICLFTRCSGSAQG